MWYGDHSQFRVSYHLRIYLEELQKGTRWKSDGQLGEREDRVFNEVAPTVSLKDHDLYGHMWIEFEHTVSMLVFRAQ